MIPNGLLSLALIMWRFEGIPSTLYIFDGNTKLDNGQLPVDKPPLYAKMSDTGALQCEFCKRANFSTKRGLTQHQLSNQRCFHLLKAKFGNPNIFRTAAAFLPVNNGLLCTNECQDEGLHRPHKAARSGVELVGYHRVPQQFDPPPEYFYQPNSDEMDDGLGLDEANSQLN